MKTEWELESEFGELIHVSAIKRVQADAILHALHVIRTTEPKQADEALTQLVFELLGEGKQPNYRKAAYSEEKELNEIQDMLDACIQRQAIIRKGMEI